MLFSHDRNKLREVFFSAWQKHENGQVPDPMEQVIINVLSQHPEYHAFFSKPDNIEKDFSPEMGQSNPFLHLSMHIAIHEQLTINQPLGIQNKHKLLMEKINDPHEAEHVMMECLGEMIWRAQRENRAPDENDYNTCLMSAINK